MKTSKIKTQTQSAMELYVKNNLYDYSLLSLLEGKRLTVYKDSLGLPTIGVGHLLKKGENYTVIDEGACRELFEDDYAIALKSCRKLFGDKSTPYQEMAIASVMFNIGEDKFKKYTKTIDLIKRSLADCCLYTNDKGESFFKFLDKDKIHTSRRECEEWVFCIGIDKVIDK